MPILDQKVMAKAVGYCSTRNASRCAGMLLHHVITLL